MFGMSGYVYNLTRTVQGLNLVQNKWSALRHLAGWSPEAASEYRLTNGLKLIVNNAKADRTAIFTVKEIFRDLSYKTPEEVKDVFNVIDLGANIGVYALYVSTVHPKARIYAVEPDPSNFSQLTRNVEVNGLIGRIVPIHAAISAVDGEAKLFSNPFSSRGHSLMWGSGSGIAVESLTLDTLLQRFEITSCDMLKIDIEGAEYDALFSASSGTMAKVGALIIEYHPIVEGDPNVYSGIGLRTFLQDHGFKILSDERDAGPTRERIGVLRAIRSNPVS